jgi:short subunit dehydrogenase
MASRGGAVDCRRVTLMRAATSRFANFPEKHCQRAGSLSRKLAENVCIITGTSGSIGRGAALTFAAQGALVVGCGLQVDAAQVTVEAVRAAGGTMISLQPCDLSRSTDCRTLADLAVRTLAESMCSLPTLPWPTSTGLKTSPTRSGTTIVGRSPDKTDARTAGPGNGQITCWERRGWVVSAPGRSGERRFVPGLR